jgi:DNA repair protein RecO (recombination protein O)
MLVSTRGNVLQKQKYGDSSLICQIFTEEWGCKAFLIKGAFKQKKASANLIHTGQILDLDINNLHAAKWLWIKSYHLHYIPSQLTLDVTKHCILLFCMELLKKLLPEESPQPEVFERNVRFIKQIDKLAPQQLHNLPFLYSMMMANQMGYDIKEGIKALPAELSYLSSFEQQIMNTLLHATDFNAAIAITVPSSEMKQLIQWTIDYLNYNHNNLGQLQSWPMLMQMLY